MARPTARLSPAVVLAVIAAASLLAEPARPLADGTRAMVAELARRTAAIPPSDLWINLNEQRAALLAQQVDTPRPVAADLRFRYLYASELLYAGRYADGIAQTDRLLELVDRAGPEAGADAYLNVLMLRALIYLRWGEDQNCVNGVNADSCLLPIARGGVHTNREGATKAAETLERLLRVDPGNMRARWLLNIAHMTLGTYPDRVPPALRIGPDVFTSPVAMPAFTNVAPDVGLGIHGISGGAVMEDLDRDGFLDVMVSGAGFDSPLRVFRNTGAGRFEEVTAQSGLDGLYGGLNLVHADFDNDGLPDVLVLRGAWMGTVGQFPVSLLKNLGGFRFADVTKAAGLDVEGPTQTAAWFDYDGDGWLDLIVGREASEAPNEQFPTRLFHSNRDGTFTDVTRAVRLGILGFVKAVVAGDYDNDGRPDLYMSQANALDRLLHNDGPQPGGGWRFTDVTTRAGVPGMPNSFPAAWFDYDNDGRLDLFIGSFLAQAEDVAADYLGLPTSAERCKLYRNKGDGTFEDVSHAAGLDRVVLAMGLNYGDLDNDGWLDLYIGTGNPEYSSLVPNRMFRNDAGKRFQEVTTAGNFGHLQKGHGIAWGDVDNDGDQDVFEEMGGAYQSDRAYSALYENPRSTAAAPKADWVSLELEGTTANRSAIGARVTVRVQTPSGPRRIHRVVGTGGSFGSSTLRVFAGVGDATAITGVEVRWPLAPSRGMAPPPETFSGVARGHHYLLKQGSARAVPLVRPAEALLRAPAPHVHESGK
jgi:hypothetical protein